MKTAHKTLALMLLIPGSTILRMFVITKLWLWFIVPLGLEPIGLAHAFGLSTFVQLVSYIHHEPPKDTTAVMFTLQSCTISAVMFTLQSCTISAVMLGVGYVTHLFMG